MSLCASACSIKCGGQRGVSAPVGWRLAPVSCFLRVFCQKGCWVWLGDGAYPGRQQKCMTDGWDSLGGLCMVCVSFTYPSGLVSACPVLRAGTGWGNMHSACSRMRDGLLSQLQRLERHTRHTGCVSACGVWWLAPWSVFAHVLSRLCWVRLGDGAYQGANQECMTDGLASLGGLGGGCCTACATMVCTTAGSIKCHVVYQRLIGDNLC